jgi:3-hydroxyacyl-[acyl-carrier-protein] dehydratase
MDLTLPLDYAAIERILPHRYPFLLVDRIIEFEVDKRIVGIKNVSLNERYLSHGNHEPPVLPPTILTEAVAQVGAIMILAKPENRQRLIFFAGIERVRFRRPVHPGDVVVIEAKVIRLRSRMGLLKGDARVNGKVVVEGTMTFALGPRGSAVPNTTRTRSAHPSAGPTSSGTMLQPLRPDCPHRSDGRWRTACWKPLRSF